MQPDLPNNVVDQLAVLEIRFINVQELRASVRYTNQMDNRKIWEFYPYSFAIQIALFGQGIMKLTNQVTQQINIHEKRAPILNRPQCVLQTHARWRFSS